MADLSEEKPLSKVNLVKGDVRKDKPLHSDFRKSHTNNDES